MAKWDFKIVGASFVKETVGSDVKFRSESFMQPSFDLEGGKIVMKESGQYKTAIYFSQIGEIAGVAPTDIDDAYAKLLTLVENFNGGGVTPQLTQDELDAIQGANSPSASNVFATINDLSGVSSTKEIVIRTETDGNYTFVIGDEKKIFILLCTNPANLTYTIPAGIFSLGDQLMVRMLNAVNSTLTYNVQRSSGSVVQYGKDESLSIVTFFEPTVGQNYWAFNYIPSSIFQPNTNITAATKTKITYDAKGFVTAGEDATKSDVGLGNVDNTSDVNKPVSTATQTSLNAKENITVATTGAVIAFATPQIYNSIASPSSSNLTDNLTGARIGVVQKIYHNAGTAPTVPAGWVRRGTGSYVTSTLNIIYAEWSVGTTVEYWITQ